MDNTWVVSRPSAQDWASSVVRTCVSEQFVLHWVLQSAPKSWKQKTQVLQTRMPPKDAVGKTTRDKLCEERRGEHGEGWAEQNWMYTLCGIAVDLIGGYLQMQ